MTVSSKKITSLAAAKWPPFGLQWPFCVFLALLTSFLACLQDQYATREQQEMAGKKKFNVRHDRICTSLPGH